MSNFVNYQVELKPENAELINQLNSLLITGSSAPAVTPASTAGDNDTADTISMDELKKVARKIKKKHGEEFAQKAITDLGFEIASSLGRSISKLDSENYAAVIAAWEAGPQASEEDDLGDDLDDSDGLDDDDGLDDNTPEVDAEAVKTALKAYAKSTGRAEAKEIMNKHGAKVLSNVDDCTPEQLAAMLKELV